MSLARFCTSGLNRFKVLVRRIWLEWALALPRNSKACWIVALMRSGSGSSFLSSLKAATSGPAVSSIKFCRRDSSQSSSSESLFTTSLMMVSSLGHLVASLSGTLNFVSHALRVLLSAGFLNTKARSRKARVESLMAHVPFSSISDGPGLSSSNSIGSVPGSSVILNGSVMPWTVGHAFSVDRFVQQCYRLWGVMTLTRQAMEYAISLMS